MNDAWFTALSVLGGLAATVIGWIIADTRSKAKLSFMEERSAALRTDVDEADGRYQKKVTAIEITLATMEQEMVSIRGWLKRIDESKASKDVVDGFRSEISNLRVDMDKRFDRLERILERTPEG